MIKAIYKSSCINCNGEIDSERLHLGLPCKNCLESFDEKKEKKFLNMFIRN